MAKKGLDVGTIGTTAKEYSQVRAKVTESLCVCLSVCTEGSHKPLN